MAKKRFTIWWMELLHPAMWHVALESWQWIHQEVAAPVVCYTWLWDDVPLNSQGGSTLQCDVALGSWHWIRQVAAPCNLAGGSGMPWNSPKRPPYWNSTSGFDFDHNTAVGMPFCTSLRNFIQIGPPSAEKKCRHFDFQDSGSQPSWILVVQ